MWTHGTAVSLCLSASDGGQQQNQGQTLVDSRKETNKGMVRFDMSKPTLIFFSLQEHTQQNPLSKF
jgi:hypothetical protein